MCFSLPFSRAFVHVCHSSGHISCHCEGEAVVCGEREGLSDGEPHHLTLLREQRAEWFPIPFPTLTYHCAISDTSSSVSLHPHYHKPSPASRDTGLQGVALHGACSGQGASLLSPVSHHMDADLQGVLWAFQNLAFEMPRRWRKQNHLSDTAWFFLHCAAPCGVRDISPLFAVCHPPSLPVLEAKCSPSEEEGAEMMHVHPQHFLTRILHFCRVHAGHLLCDAIPFSDKEQTAA